MVIFMVKHNTVYTIPTVYTRKINIYKLCLRLIFNKIYIWTNFIKGSNGIKISNQKYYNPIQWIYEQNIIVTSFQKTAHTKTHKSGP